MLMWERGGGVMGALQRNENISAPVEETLPDAEPILEPIPEEDDELDLNAVSQVVEPEEDDELLPVVTPAKKKGKG